MADVKSSLFGFVETRDKVSVTVACLTSSFVFVSPLLEGERLGWPFLRFRSEETVAATG